MPIVVMVIKITVINTLRRTKTKLKSILPPEDSDSFDMPLIKRRFKAENLNQNQKERVYECYFVNGHDHGW